jgi:hypothetical protein
MSFQTLATFVTPNATTAQLAAVAALIVFIVAALVAAGTRAYHAIFISLGLALLAAAMLWSL